MTPSSPNCIVEISDVIETKLAAFEPLSYQMGYSAHVRKERLGPQLTRGVVPGSDPEASDTVVGLELMQRSERANALSHGIGGHSGAVMGEAYRKGGVLTLDGLAP